MILSSATRVSSSKICRSPSGSKPARQAQAGDGQLTWKELAVKFSGGVRFIVVLSGIVLLVGAVSEGHEGFDRAREAHQQDEIAASAERMRVLRETISAQIKAQLELDAASGGLPIELRDPRDCAVGCVVRCVEDVEVVE